MSVGYYWKFSGLALAGMFLFVLVAGCSNPVSITFTGSTGLAQTQPGVRPPQGGLALGNIQGNTDPFPVDNEVNPNPAAGILAVTSLLESVTLGGCVKQPTVTVPDLTNMPLAQAEAALLFWGLKPGNIRLAFSITVPSGSVISQDPAVGVLVVSGTVVNLLASFGPKPVDVPDVAGKIQADAQLAIAGAGLVVGTTTQSYSAMVPSGSVISQDPAAGTSVLPGTAVNLLLSQGPQPVAVPNVMGQTQADAQTAITGAGLTVGSVALGSSATVTAGCVMSQNPVADSMALPGTAVDLVISQGPEPVPVPAIVGRTLFDAQAAITGTGFSVGTVTRAWSAIIPLGSVISQDPAAGVTMVPGSPVSLVVSQGPQPVPVPNVAGMAQAEAQTAIAGAGLTVGTVTRQYSDTIPEGSVVGQNPAEGTLLPPGAPVNLVIAKKTLLLCEYYPLAVGNTWVTPGTTGNNGTSLEISEEFIINGSKCWKFKDVDHSANDATTYYYAAYANGWMYIYEVLDDLFLLPAVSPNAQKIGPESVTPGVPFSTNNGGMTLTVTPVRGRLSDFVADTSLCPYGDVQDTVALKMGNLVLLVLGRDLGPLYYNYLTSSGFYSAITIVGGGCGTAP